MSDVEIALLSAAIGVVGSLIGACVGAYLSYRYMLWHEHPRIEIEVWREAIPEAGVLLGFRIVAAGRAPIEIEAAQVVVQAASGNKRLLVRKLHPYPIDALNVFQKQGRNKLEFPHIFEFYDRVTGSISLNGIEKDLGSRGFEAVEAVLRLRETVSRRPHVSNTFNLYAPEI